MQAGDRSAGPWERPNARRLCELVLVSPRRRIGKEVACEALFPKLNATAATLRLSKTLSMARAALTSLGSEAAGLFQTDRCRVWASDEIEVDFVAHEEALRYALSLSPGGRHDNLLAQALTEEGTLLEDEPYADWAIGPREGLEVLRQEARLALARDRAKGAGLHRPEAVIDAWASCFDHDAACEEAATALMLTYSAQGQRYLAARTYERCRATVQDLGLPVPRSLEEALARSALAAPADVAGLPHTVGEPLHEERRLVSVLCAEVVGPQESAGAGDPEDFRELVGGALARTIGVVEALGGSVTSISGTRLQAVFGAPEAHEDDPERAVRAALRALTARPAALRHRRSSCGSGSRQARPSWARWAAGLRSATGR